VVPTSCYYYSQSFKESKPLHEPPYLKAMKAQYPTYDLINVKITGYDFPVLESYQRFLHRIATELGLDVSENWAHPPKKENVIRYKQNSAIPDSEYQLTTYERYIQVSDIETPIYPLFLRFIQGCLPEGVHLTVVHHTDVIESSRYVPDRDLLDLKAQLEAAGGPLATRKKY
jgi:large subunit ribosomal protein L48